MIQGQSQVLTTRNLNTISWTQSNVRTHSRCTATHSSTPLARRGYGTLMNQLYFMKDRAESDLRSIRRVWANRLASHVVPFFPTLWNKPANVKAIVLKWVITKVWNPEHWDSRNWRLHSAYTVTQVSDWNYVRVRQSVAIKPATNSDSNGLCSGNSLVSRRTLFGDSTYSLASYSDS